MADQCLNMRAFASDDEGFFLFLETEFEVNEHVAEFLAALHS